MGLYHFTGQPRLVATPTELVTSLRHGSELAVPSALIR
jgi:hypothetical protein